METIPVKLPVTERIKTFEDACNALGINIESLILHFSEGFNQDVKAIMAYSKLIIIARALNEGWTADWKDDEQPKYTPWFEYKKGSGLVFNDSNSWYSTTDVGSRLCFVSRDIAKYAATQFADIYSDFLN